MAAAITAMSDAPAAVITPAPRASCEHLRALLSAQAIPALPTLPAATTVSAADSVDASFTPLPHPAPLSDLHALLMVAASNKAAVPVRRTGLKATVAVQVSGGEQATSGEKQDQSRFIALNASLLCNCCLCVAPSLLRRQLCASQSHSDGMHGLCDGVVLGSIVRVHRRSQPCGPRSKPRCRARASCGAGSLASGVLLLQLRRLRLLAAARRAPHVVGR